MKSLFVIALLTFSTTAFSEVFKSYDAEHGCDLYRVYNEHSNPKLDNEVVVFPKAVYGLSFEDMDVNFDNREAKVQVIMNVILGFNRPLIEEKSSIESSNPNFTFLVNRLNRSVSSMERICITSDNKIIYGELFKTSQK